MEAMARPLAERFVAAGNRPLRDLFGHGIDVLGNILGSLTICHGTFASTDAVFNGPRFSHDRYALGVSIKSVSGQHLDASCPCCGVIVGRFSLRGAEAKVGSNIKRRCPTSSTFSRLRCRRRLRPQRHNAGRELPYQQCSRQHIRREQPHAASPCRQTCARENAPHGHDHAASNPQGVQLWSSNSVPFTRLNAIMRDVSAKLLPLRPSQVNTNCMVQFTEPASSLVAASTDRIVLHERNRA